MRFGQRAIVVVDVGSTHLEIVHSQLRFGQRVIVVVDVVGSTERNELRWEEVELLERPGGMFSYFVLSVYTSP